MLKSYCLKCEKPNMGCKCQDKIHHIFYSYKLRVPLTTKNKARFRTFVLKTHIFANCVPERLQPEFRDFLRRIKLFDVAINGFEWTRVKKGSSYEIS